MKCYVLHINRQMIDLLHSFCEGLDKSAQIGLSPIRVCSLLSGIASTSVNSIRRFPFWLFNRGARYGMSVARLDIKKKRIDRICGNQYLRKSKLYYFML